MALLTDVTIEVEYHADADDDAIANLADDAADAISDMRFADLVVERLEAAGLPTEHITVKVT